MGISQHKARRTFVFENPASASSWNLTCVRRLADLSEIYSVTSDWMKLYTNSGAIDGWVDHRLPKDDEHDLSDVIIVGFIMERDSRVERG